MRNLPLLLGTILGTLALIIGIVWLMSRPQELEVVTDQMLLLGDVRNVKGPADAPITVVEFSDLQCPACRAVQPLLTQLLAQYPDQVRVVYRHFPLVSIHPYATMAAYATEAAGEDGKFWEMHDLLFNRQLEWNELENDQAVRDKFVTYAEELGIDKDAFLERIDSDQIKQRITIDVTAGGQLKVNATPTLYVNGQKLAAPQQLLPTVESILNQAQ